MAVQFGVYELDREAFELRREGAPVPMEPQVFEVLAYLVDHADRMVTKEELLDQVWGDRFVSESALTSRIKSVRQALGDDGRAQRLVRTVHGRGYRFVGEVLAVAAPPPPQPAPVDDGGRRDNLPTARTPLFGRAADVAAVRELVRQRRLVTLLGFGGAGKTRLATTVARAAVDDFPDGVWFVDLVPARDERDVAVAVAHSAGLALPPGDPVERLADVVTDRRALFVVDNCEHVRAAAARVLDHLLEHTRQPWFLATSREPLELPDEHRFVVRPLEVEAEVGVPPAVELFLAAAQRFGAVVPPSAGPEVRRICAQLDGLPLALELAAAQLRVFTPPELARRLEHRHDERFTLLAGQHVVGRPRHQDLLSVLEDTWALTSAAELDLLTLLATLTGRFTLVDAEELAGERPGEATAVLLGHLVDRSLVVRETGSTTTYRLLETVRLYALHRCSDRRRRAIADRHAAWCTVRVGDDPGRHLYDFSMASWCLAHGAELRLAEQHLLSSGRPDRAAALTTAMGLAMHVDVGGYAAEVLHRIDEHLARVQDVRLRTRLHLTGVTAGMAVRSPETIARHGAQGLVAAREAGDPGLLAVALVFASWAEVFRDPHAALAMVEEAGELARAAGDQRGRNLADGYRAFHLAKLRRYDEAVAQSEAVIERMPDGPTDQAEQVAVTGWTAFTVVDDPIAARRWLPQLVGLPTPQQAMWANQILAAVVHAANGDAMAAEDLVRRVRERLARAGRDPLPDLLVPAAVLARRCGEDARAARWLRAVRDAGRPTQSFHVTCVYRRLRDRVGIAETSPLVDRSLTEVGEEAVAWMQRAAARQG